MMIDSAATEPTSAMNALHITGVIAIAIALLATAAFGIRAPAPAVVWDVPTGYERFHQLCMDEPRLRYSNYCRCAAACYDEQFAVRDTGDAVRFLQCMAACACDARGAICMVLAKKKPDAVVTAVCARFTTVCETTKKHELVAKRDPRGLSAHDDSRFTEQAVDHLVGDGGFCMYCVKGYSTSVACIPCLLLTDH